MKFFDYAGIKHIHLELTKKCNAYCPSCLRVSGDPQKLNPFVNHQQEIDLEILKQNLNQEFLEQIEDILICGNEGDPLASKNLIEVLEHIKNFNPGLNVQIHTNGSLRDPNFYKELANIMNLPGWFIRFAIDGLEDTNAIYRRGVSFKKVMENSKSFIDSGGRADWMWVDFEHNAHQVEDAEKLASDMGFRKFIRRKNTDPNIDFSKVEATVRDFKKELPKFNTHSNQEIEDYYSKALTKLDSQNKEIKCWALEYSSIYIDSEMQVWPCCWLGQGHLAHDSLEREHFLKNTFEKYGSGFNSLMKKSLRQILDESFFSKDLLNSFEKTKGDSEKGCLPKCVSTCGR